MLRNRPSSPTPIRQRRRQRQQPPSASHSHFTYHNTVPRSKIPSASLELSLHLPANPSCNRFEALRGLKLSPRPTRGDHRRIQNSRGTKAAKRRRDVRRGRRKQIVQLLDEQLSRGIDAMLANITPFPQQIQNLSPPPRVWPVNRFVLPTPTRAPSPALRLPALDFSTFNMEALTELAQSFGPPTPIATPPPSRRLSSWCPSLPSLTRDDIWRHDEPIFYDLSGLPEPRVLELPDPSQCQELQVWQGNVYLKPKKQSRFFPPLPRSPKPKVRLPPVACRPHLPDNDSHKWLGTGTAGADCMGDVVSNVEPSSDTEEAAQGPIDDMSFCNPSAANLWHILTSTCEMNNEETSDPYLASFQPTGDEDPAMSAFGTPGPMYYQIHAATKFDGRALPYVYANSFTGHANEVALSPYAEEHPSLKDSGIYITPLSEPPYSLNETMVDQDYPCDMRIDYTVSSAEQSPRAPRTSAVSSPRYILADELPTDCGEEDGGAASLRRSDAQFQSEQELFEMPSSSMATPARSAIDVASFLKLGHANNCWCGECQEEPQLYGGTQLRSESSEDIENGWTVCSTNELADFEWPDATLPAAGVDTSEDMAHSRCSTVSDWDEVGSCLPSPLWETVVVKNTSVEVVDYCDSEWDFDYEF